MNKDDELLELFVEREYKNGFNVGYLLAKHEPDNLKRLLEKAKKIESTFARGLLGGRKQFEKEKFLSSPDHEGKTINK